MDFTGKTALVTGASGGIGRVIARGIVPHGRRDHARRRRRDRPRTAVGANLVFAR